MSFNEELRINEELRKRRKVAASKIGFNPDKSINIEKFTLQDFHSIFLQVVYRFDASMFGALVDIEVATAEALFKRNVVDELIEIAGDLLGYDKK